MNEHHKKDDRTTHKPCGHSEHIERFIDFAQGFTWTRFFDDTAAADTAESA